MLLHSVFLSCLVTLIAAHGRLRDPPSRSSLWRETPEAPANYNDNELFCGGFGRQWETNGGKCGICGDPWDAPEPRENELGGTYGQGIISRKYKRGQVIDTWIELTTNHLGWFELSICPLDKKGQDATEECFKQHRLQLADGSGTRVAVPSKEKNFKQKFQLPSDLTCDHCVIQWNYNTGNRWDKCPDGTSKLGCGPQETFRGCADVSIQ